MKSNTLWMNWTRTEGAQPERPLRGLEDRLNRIIKFSTLAQTYFSSKNTGAIDPQIIDGLYVLIRNINHEHSDELNALERLDVRRMERELREVAELWRQYRNKAQMVASNVEALTKRTRRYTRSTEDVRAELAGISAKISKLMQGETLPPLNLQFSTDDVEPL